MVRREPPSDRRPKSSYTGRGDGSPQSPRDKRPLSGPSIRAPVLPVLPVSEGPLKPLQPSARPFNTFPRTDSEGGRSPTGQVRQRTPRTPHPIMFRLVLLPLRTAMLTTCVASTLQPDRKSIKAKCIVF